MKPQHRSLTGLAIALLSLPVFMGLLACLPVPIGDPEKSRIDPDLSGMWIMDGQGIVLFEPFDKRTWLLTYVEINSDWESCPGSGGTEHPDDATEDEAEVDPYSELVERMSNYDESCFGASEVQLFKAWRARLGGEWFMTWEQKGGYGEDRGFAPELWWGWRIRKAGADEFSLWILDADYDGFDDLEAYQKLADLDAPYDAQLLKKARREAERVIRRNMDDPELYLDTDEPYRFQRVRPEHHDLFAGILDDVVKYEEKMP